jgi:hypothetical protein
MAITDLALAFPEFDGFIFGHRRLRQVRIKPTYLELQTKSFTMDQPV